MCHIVAVGLPASKSQTHRRAVLAGLNLTICVGRDTRDVATYAVAEHVGVPFPARGFRLTKLAGGTDQEAVNYDVLIDPAGHSTCECRGFLRWGGPCKHIDALVHLLAEGALDPAPAVCPECANHGYIPAADLSAEPCPACGG